MRYYEVYEESGALKVIGTGEGGTEITKERYQELLAEIHAKAKWVDMLLGNEATLEDVPVEWQEEVANRVNKLQKANLE